jgi:hypothetical protein
VTEDHATMTTRGTSHGFTIQQTRIDGTSAAWSVSGCGSPEEARQKAVEWAQRDGWHPPKWWQWWRWNDQPRTAE